MTEIRTPDQRLRVFVSSTMNELADVRVAARRAIEQLHLTPVMFELGARPYPPRDLYLAYLAQTDVFVAIYGESYGTVEPGRTVSGLEDEYLAASGKPQLVYVCNGRRPRREPRLAAMLERVARSGVTYRTFTHPEELVALIGNDLALLLSERFDATGAAAAAAHHDAGTGGVGTDGGKRTAVSERAVGVRDDLRRLGTTNQFIGRRRELRALRALSTDSQTRLLTLVGPGGIGKTRIFRTGPAAHSTAPTPPKYFNRAALAAGTAVSTLQEALGIPEAERDGVFSDRTQAALRAFQDQHELPADGVVTSPTWGPPSPTRPAATGDPGPGGSSGCPRWDSGPDARTSRGSLGTTCGTPPRPSRSPPAAKAVQRCSATPPRR